MALLDIRHVNIKYKMQDREILACDDISLSMEPQDSLGIVGESGSGKSTVGRCCLRLIEPDAGQIRLSSAAAGDLLGLANWWWRGVARERQKGREEA